jgi:hypothetical protein
MRPSASFIIVVIDCLVCVCMELSRLHNWYVLGHPIPFPNDSAKIRQRCESIKALEETVAILKYVM